MGYFAGRWPPRTPPTSISRTFVGLLRRTKVSRLGAHLIIALTVFRKGQVLQRAPLLRSAGAGLT